MLPEKLRDIRKKNKITQGEVAEYLGILRQSYSAYERGISTPDARQLKKLADYFNVSTDYFFGGVNLELPTAQNEQEQKLLVLARRATGIPPEQRQKLIENFEANVDLFLEALGTAKKG